MKTGIFYWFGYPLPMDERFKLIASAGFDNVLLWWGDQYANDDGPKEKLPDLARKAGLFIENIHTDFDNAYYIWLDNADGEGIFNRYFKDIEDCKKYDIPAMVVHLTNGYNFPPPGKAGLDRLKRLVEKAEKCNVTIALENLRKTSYLDFAFKQIDSPKLKLCYDSGHENCFTKEGDVLDRFGDKLICLHLHDNDGSGDQHMLPGEGTINWPELIQKLKNCNFNGSVTLEANNDFPEKYKNYSAEQFLSRAYAEAGRIADKLTKI